MWKWSSDPATKLFTATAITIMYLVIIAAYVLIQRQ